MKTLELISAGGVAVRNADVQIDVALIKTSREDRWQLPKGHLDRGETLEQAAVREVREEAGIACEILEKIDVIDYWFIDRYGSEPTRTHKFVHFFLMQYVSGNVADHDDEVVEACWMSSEEALQKLAFDTERNVVLKALDSLK